MHLLITEFDRVVLTVGLDTWTACLVLLLLFPPPPFYFCFVRLMIMTKPILFS